MNGIAKGLNIQRRLLIALISAVAVTSIYFYFQNRLNDAEKISGASPLPEYNNPSKTVKTELGKDFVITLESNPTTGYGWRIAGTLDATMLKVVEIKHSRKQTKLIGAGGKDLWTFRGLQKGKTVISFEYVRSWEKDVPPVKKEFFTVEIK